MKKLELVVLLSNLVLFVVLNLLFWKFSVNGKKDKQKKRVKIRLTYNPKSLLYIFISALSLTYLISSLTFSNKTDIVVFLSLMGMIPYVVNGELTRRKQETIFNDVILYCHNMAMLLKQNHNVYSSLQKVVDDINDPLKSDIEKLMVSFDKSKNDSLEMMNYLEDKYQYSCLKDLNIILTYMFYENSLVSDELLDNFQDDIERLNQDVKDNESKRKTLRLQYILITIGSLLSYWFLLKEVKNTFEKTITSDSFNRINTLFIFLTLFCLFIVDRFFNSNMTKE